ncbi:YqhG family protein [Paenibacillus sp. M1]|uniref:YqhG family protein n=1 Tax=Paenibacillus haidiansis TaxID=1574488 RepID=A0ABU7VNS1_9BACL
MSMTQEQIREFVMTYLESTECQFLEKSPYHVTVKLSPRADRELTNRPYYWGFIERTGTPPETMTFSFIFDAERHRNMQQASEANNAAPAQEDPLLARHFGAVRPLPILGPGRIQQEELYFGSPRLKQIFAAARQGGRTVYLFEDPGPRQRSTLLPAAYEPWLGVRYKIDFCCDMKREELHFIGVSLLTGRIDEDFGARLSGKALIPRMPENMHIAPSSFSLPQGRQALEARIGEILQSYDSSWADEARDRLGEELALIDAYYKDLLNDPDEERKLAVLEQYEARKGEIRWQYEPRIVVSALGSGIFHLRSPR